MEPTSCLALIKTHEPTLTPTERKVTDYIRANGKAVVHMSVQEFSQQAGVVKSAIIRCCKTLGFSGFPALKIALSADVSHEQTFSCSPYIEPHDDVNSITDKVFSANIKTLHDTARHMDRTALCALVEALANAPHVYIYGIGTSAALCRDFQYRLMQIGCTAICLTDVPSMKVSTMNICAGDVAIGISHSGRTIATVETLQMAKAQGAITACITSFARSPITACCDHAVVICSEEIRYPIESVSARIAHITVMDAVTMALSARNYDETLRRSQKTHELVNTVRYED